MLSTFLIEYKEEGLPPLSVEAPSVAKLCRGASFVLFIRILLVS